MKQSDLHRSWIEALETLAGRGQRALTGTVVRDNKLRTCDTRHSLRVEEEEEEEEEVVVTRG